NVLIGVAQARDVEFIANNPGDWIMHCHMFHHMMNHMVSMAGPMMRVAPDDPRGKVPGFPQNMEGMKMMIPEDDPRQLNKRETRGMRRDWSMIKGLTTVIRVLPPDLYDQVVSGNDPLPPGSSVFGPKPGRLRPS